MVSNAYVLPFSELGHGDLALVGGKNASLGEMYGQLAGQGIPVPNGFALTTRAYREMLAAGLEDRLRAVLEGLDVEQMAALAAAGRACRELVAQTPLPDDALAAIEAAYGKLEGQYGGGVRVAVRSSATAEDLPDASFAGQHDSYLDIGGAREVAAACHRCLASLFTDRAIRYRADRGFDHLKVALSVGVMKMVRSDIGASGVIFTLDTESGFPGVVLLTAAWGLGENVVQGAVDPDEFTVHKDTLRQGHRVVLRRRLGEKAIRMVCRPQADGATLVNEATPEADRRRFALTDEEVLTLTDYALAIEDHYSALAGHAVPMDVEWARDGDDGRLYVVQARPETVASRANPNELVHYRLDGSGPVLAEGRAVGSRIAAGRACVIRDAVELPRFEAGSVLVADTTAPDWGSVIKSAAAVVTNHGGRTCHAAIVAREVGIPAVVGSGDATERIADGAEVTVSCADGEAGRVYAGRLPYSREVTDLTGLERPRTRIMVNLGNPDLAFRTAMLPCDGVGLARLEFIITEAIGIHPMALAHPERISDPAQRAHILEVTAGYDSPAAFFVGRLAEGVGTIAAAFYPRPVVVRLSDFKVNEYASLAGGADFEVAEANPMIGFRGASRYAHPAYADGFALECQALARVRGAMGLNNVKVMVPFCRRLDEADRVLAAMAEHGLVRGADGLEIYVMCEIPNNVMLIDEFAERFDGFSIGSNDLTQLTLGVDRDSEVVAFDFDERDPGVMKMLELAVTGARRNGRHSGICGQAPSDYPEVAEFLVRLGIDSISLNPDTVLPTTQRILALERELGDGGNADSP